MSSPQEKFEWIEEPVDKKVKQGTVDEVSFTCKLSHKGKKAKWYVRNQVRTDFIGACLSSHGRGSSPIPIQYRTTVRIGGILLEMLPKFS